MPDKTLSILVIAIIVLFAGHDIDHFLRGDFKLGSPAEAAAVVTVMIAQYVIFGFGLFFYVKGKLGPGFWAILAGLSVALAWLAHFSPFSEQTPQFIYGAYEAPAAGASAVALLAVLMLVLIATMLYATVVWARASR
jgi:hypothetical protein